MGTDLANGMSKMMTVKQVAEALGVAPVTVNQNVAKLFPGLAINGVTTFLNEMHVTAIKLAIERSGRNDLMNVNKVSASSTELEMMMLDAKVSEWKNRRIAELSKKVGVLQIENMTLKPKAESHDALMRSEKTMSITQCAKHFGLHPKTEVFPYLRDRGYLTSKDLPSQSALDADILELREARDKFTDAIYPQAVVLTRQLEKWRTVVIPNIDKWKLK